VKGSEPRLRAALSVPSDSGPLPGPGLPVRCPVCLHRMMTPSFRVHWFSCSESMEGEILSLVSGDQDGAA